MSIFKTKLWWSSDNLQEDKQSDGLQNNNSLIVDKFSSHNDSDCIVLCEWFNLKIYKPVLGDHHASIVLEKQLDSFILQVDTGKFIINSSGQQIIVLHAQSYSVYALERREGHIEAGEQNLFTKVISHQLSKKAHSLICGNFGNMKTRELVCVQALDGSLSFFDQDVFIFSCVYADVVVPGPISYIASCDSFVICKSTWILEIYSYQQLRDFSDSSTRQNKKNVPQWIYNAGEEISSIQVIQTSNNFSSIIALGERYLYCFQDNGLMKFMKKFDFMPMCFHAYLIGWYYEPGARLLVMVASEDSNLFIYEGTTLLWACDLLHKPVAISRCFLKGLSGGLVTLSTDGVVTVSYIGTEPDLTGFGQAPLNESYNPETVQTELDAVEETLQKITGNNEDGDENIAIEAIVNINIDVGKPVQNLFDETEYFDKATLHLLMSPVIIKLTFEDPASVKGLQVSYICHPPFASSDSTICLDSVNGTEIIETHVFVSSELDFSNASMKVMFTITNDSGKIMVVSKAVALPINLFCVPVECNNDYIEKIVIQTNSDHIDLLELYSEFTKEEFLNNGCTSSDLSFKYRASKKSIRLSTSNEDYCIQSNDFTDFITIIENLISKLEKYYSKKGNEFKFQIRIDKDLSNRLIHRFLKCIDTHAKARIKMKGFEDELSILQKQFTLIQKKLLVQFGSLPPGDCDPLEFLMKDTYKRITDTTHEIIQCRESVCRAGNSIISVGNLVIYILRLKTPDQFKVKLVEEMLTLQSLYEDYQDWEEAVSQGISYILNKVFTKTEKDKERLAAVTEQGILSHINLKRFIKQIRVILDRMFSEILESGQESSNTIEAKQPKVVRVEEFVEVI